MIDRSVFARLLRPHADAYVFFAGLLHLAAQPSCRQRCVTAARERFEDLHLGATRWQLTTFGPGNLDSLVEYLEDAADIGDLRLAVAMGAAAMGLEQSLGAAHATDLEIELPPDPPFDGARYRILEPPANPIAEWLDEAGLVAEDRDRSNFEPDPATVWGLRWRAFPAESPSHGVRTSFERMPLRLAERFAKRIEERCLTVGLVAPSEGIQYDFAGYGEKKHPMHGTPYRFVGLGCDAARARTEIDLVLERCRVQEIEVLMYPELTLDPDLLGYLREHLEMATDHRFPLMVIGGSFHEPAENPGRYVNRTRVFDYRGQEILRHDKLQFFELTSHDLSLLDAEARADLCRSLCIDPQSGGYERIDGGETLRVMDGPLGRMITSICIDFLHPIRQVAVDSGCNLFWVPAMSPSFGKFRSTAREMAQYNRATTVVVNSEWLLQTMKVPGSDAMRYLCYLPCAQKSDEPPVACEVDDVVPSLRLCKIGETLERRADDTRAQPSKRPTNNVLVGRFGPPPPKKET